MCKKIPLISIIITTYKRKESFKTALESACSQTYENIEIIVVDDNASQIEYREWVSLLITDFPSVIYVQNKKNLGGALARNVGIKVSQGEFVAFLDDDDEYTKDKITKQYEYYKQNKFSNIGLIYCYATSVDSKGEKLGVYNNNFEGNPLYQHMLACIAGTSLWFATKKSLEKVGMFEDTPCKQDSILLLKLLAANYNICCVPEELVFYTEDNVGKISGVGLKNIEGLNNYRKWCRKYYNKIDNKQKKEIEYNFSKQLITLYIINDLKSKARLEAHNMSKLFLFRTKTIFAYIKCWFPSTYKKILLLN